ncbi:hypothetical protein DUNSADRAFT_10217 [Dunaliella salina]|uniref:Secreted protein n=1 Tax=Dunaliella salina TaxID=3046 RepID=A0ABQ7GFS3_DUNSA|nr:hypothetical protein DUNSADRAFT_10217 [Dunaliella salina]|eukprot:KAF5833463.1 hypothetical protein DUNSADRAFT_10217 [Dunaliella salina]
MCARKCVGVGVGVCVCRAGALVQRASSSMPLLTCARCTGTNNGCMQTICVREHFLHVNKLQARTMAACEHFASMSVSCVWTNCRHDPQ